MSEITKQQLGFGMRNRVVVEFYSDEYGQNVRVRYTNNNGVEHGIVNLIGARNSSGKPHTVDTIISEGLQVLLQNTT